ncbi:MAG TPA: hypothetical protein PKW79_06800, partial [Rhabdochlamydiaceae bacterium]|nr:hypothetical protein [Rhabdochlamydiaceae bacterium]
CFSQFSSAFSSDHTRTRFWQNLWKFDAQYFQHLFIVLTGLWNLLKRMTPYSHFLDGQGT